MKRKLIRQGSGKHGSFTVTLPVDWTRKHGMKSGDEIDVTEMGNSLLIGSAKGFEYPKNVRIDARKLLINMVWRKTAEAYRAGADNISIEYENKTVVHKKTGRRTTVRDEIERVASTECIGMEIEDVTPTSVIMRQFGEMREEEFNGAFRKIFFKLEDQAENTAQALKTLDSELLRSIWFGDRAINRFSNYCMRILNRIGSPDPKKMTRLYAALVQLEVLGDMLFLLTTDVKKLNIKKVHPDVIKLIKNFKKAIRAYSDYFYTHDDSKPREVTLLRDELYDIQEKSKKWDVGNNILLKRLEFTYDLLVNMIDCAISTTPTLKNPKEDFK